MPKILITGCNGFIGNYLKKKLSKKHQVFGLSHTLKEKNVYHWQELEGISETFDFVILAHAAVSNSGKSIAEEEAQHVNIDLTKKVLEKFKNAKFIYLSTASVFKPDGIITEESSFSPSNIYSKSKYLAGLEVLKYQSKILFLPSVFGKKMDQNTFLPKKIKEALSTQKIIIFGKGNRKQNYLSLKNVKHYVSHLIKNFNVDGTYFLAADTIEFSNKEVAEIIAKHTKAQIIFEGEDLSPSFYYNNNKTRENLKINFNCNFEKDLSKFIKWNKKQYW